MSNLHKKTKRLKPILDRKSHLTFSKIEVVLIVKPNSKLSQRQANSLEWIIPDTYDLHKFPDFLVLGPQRTGSTWLHFNLDSHPDILMSREKELRFFHLTKWPNSPQFRSNKLSWYLSNFEDPKATDVVGEATPAYLVTLSTAPALMADLITINPEIKGIATIRNPVERAWSHAKLKLMLSGKTPEAQPFEYYEKFYTAPYIRQCADCGHIDKWKANLRPGNVLTVRFDDIQRSPDELLESVFDFLDVPNLPTKNSRNTINASHSAMAIPDQHLEYLLKLHHDDLERIKDRYGYTWY